MAKKKKKKTIMGKIVKGTGNAILQIAGAKNTNDAKKKLKRSLLG